MAAPRNDGSGQLLAVGAIALAFVAFDTFFGEDAAPGPGDGHVGPSEPQLPTLTFERMTQLADVIDEALLGGWFEAEAVSTAAILQCRNNADIIGLIQVFGTRSPDWWLAASYTLPGAVAHFYDPGQKATLNAGLSALGITYTFQ